LTQLGSLLHELHPAVIAIDSPPHFAAAGSSRQCERELARLGIHCYFTPAKQAASGNRFYDWMRQGHRVFALAAEAGYPLYRPGRPVRGSAIEVFPHASAVVLRESLPPSGCSKNRRRKARWRREALQRSGVATGQLASLDLIDAALAALTGLLALEGCFCTVGDSRPEDGVIVLPARRLAHRYARTR
jgi:predicted nuclease with RNAse H fold